LRMTSWGRKTMGGLSIVTRYRHTHNVTPAKAGVHPEIYDRGSMSGWIPAFAGMTSLW